MQYLGENPIRLASNPLSIIGFLIINETIIPTRIIQQLEYFSLTKYWQYRDIVITITYINI